MKNSSLSILVLMGSLLIGIVTAAPFPQTGGIDADNFTHENLTGTVTYGQVIEEPLKTWQTDVIPWPLWALIAAIGIIFLGLSLFIPERAELTSALLGFGFATAAWQTAPVIGFGDVVSYTINGDLLVIQPVSVVFLSSWLSYLFLFVWIVALLNLLLATFNFLGSAAAGEKIGKME